MGLRCGGNIREQRNQESVEGVRFTFNGTISLFQIKYVGEEMNKQFQLKQFVIITLITSIWIHISETVRALLVAFPRMTAFFGDRIEIIGPENFTLSHALIWGCWDMLLTATLVFILWLCAQVFGNSLKSIVISGTVTCFATIGVFWIATVNTGLGDWSTAFLLLPLAWIELLIGALIASKLYLKKQLT